MPFASWIDREQRYALRTRADHQRWLLMSDLRAAGWDRPTIETTERHLCSHHRASTERVSTHTANQIARACPWCANPDRPEPEWTNGVSRYRHGD